MLLHILAFEVESSEMPAEAPPVLVEPGIELPFSNSEPQRKSMIYSPNSTGNSLASLSSATLTLGSSKNFEFHVM